MYRGKFLGNQVTDEQYAEIAAGTFNDLFIGDYWTIDDRNYLIAHFDYFMNASLTNADWNNHHAVIVPDKILYSTAISYGVGNSTNDGFKHTLIYSSGLDQAKTIINSAFNGHVMKHWSFIVSKAENGYPIVGNKEIVTVNLMSEIMAYGCSIYSRGNIDNRYRNSSFDKSQLSIYRYRQDLLNGRISKILLRDTADSENFCSVDNFGFASKINADYLCGVLPYFCIF